MKIFDRVARLVKSDAHGILDQLEERSLLLKQHLRDAELELRHKHAQVEALAEQQRQLREEADRLDARVASLDEDVELALAGEKDELARFAIRRLLPVREANRGVKAKIAEVAASRDRVAERLAEQEAEFEELERRVQTHLAEERHERQTPPPPERSVADEEVELELLRRSSAAGDE